MTIRLEDDRPIATTAVAALYVETALRKRLQIGTRFESARIRPLHDQKHAYNTFRYVHRQDAHHELELDCAREGTSLPDLLGLRVLSSTLIARVRASLPRIRRDDLTAHFPAGAFEVTSAVDLDVLADAAAATFALPDLRGRAGEVTRARCAAVHVAGRDVRTEHLADCLGVGIRAVQRLRSTVPEPLVIRAVERQMILRTIAPKAAAPSV